MTHDPLCPLGPNCECELIAQVRADEREKILAQFMKLPFWGNSTLQDVDRNEAIDVIKNGNNV